MFERILLAFLSAVTLGALCGWLTGRSDPESVVIAAAVPTILSIGAALFFWMAKGSGGPSGGRYATAFIVGAAFAVGLNSAAGKRNADAQLSVVNAMAQRIELVFECSRTQKFLNEIRAEQDQPPLSFHDVCDFGR